MAINTEKNSYTVLFAIGMVLVVGSLLAFLAMTLKPTITENERLEKQQNILYAMGVNNNEGSGDVSFVPTSEVAEEFNKYIKKQLIIQGDDVKEDPEAYLLDIKKEADRAKDPSYTRKLPV